jgi:hypothetical protein
MKSSNALTILVIAAGVCAPAWSQDYPGVAGDDPYASDPSANAFGTSNPYSPNSPPNSYEGYGNPYDSLSVANPYATDAPKTHDPNGDYGGRGDANRYDPYSPSNSYGPYGKPDRRPSAATPILSDSANIHDQSGEYGGGLTSRLIERPARWNPNSLYGGLYGLYGPTNSYRGYDNPYDIQSAANPIAADAQKFYGQFADHDERMTSNPYDPYPIPNPHGLYGESYGRSYGADAPKVRDPNGGYDGRLTSNPYDPLGVNPYDPLAANPYDPLAASNPSGRYGDPFADPLATDHRAEHAPDPYDQYGSYDGGLAGNPRDPRGAPSHGLGAGDLSSNHSAENPRAASAPKIDNQTGVYKYKKGSSLNPFNADAAPNPYGQYANPKLPDSVGNPFEAASPYSLSNPRNP